MRWFVAFGLLASCVLSAPLNYEANMCLASIGLPKLALNLERTYNYTCDECHRMMNAMQYMCKERDALIPRLSEFHDLCVDFTFPVVFPNHTWALSDRCNHFLAFTLNTYCPQDPCVQITNTHNKAPEALCKLLACSVEKLPPQAPKGPPPAPIPPLTCPIYMTEIVRQCHSAFLKGVYPKVRDMCNVYKEDFPREGCELVADRLLQTSAPMPPCDFLKCDSADLNVTQYCIDMIHLGSEEIVPADGYQTYLALLMGNKIVLREDGVNFTTATYGTGCKPNSTDNILGALRNLCQKKMTCSIPNPNVFQLTNTTLEPECGTDFEIFYTCTTGGKVHRIFSPADPKYHTVDISCAKELPPLPPLQHDTLPLATPEPVAKDSNPYALYTPPFVPASFDTPEMAAQRSGKPY